MGIRALGLVGILLRGDILDQAQISTEILMGSGWRPEVRQTHTQFTTLLSVSPLWSATFVSAPRYVPVTSSRGLGWFRIRELHGINTAKLRNNPNVKTVRYHIRA